MQDFVFWSVWPSLGGSLAFLVVYPRVFFSSSPTHDIEISADTLGFSMKWTLTEVNPMPELIPQQL